MANILNIQRFCTQDGPGIRTTVFFKGCPLSCLWCHNPEAQSTVQQIMFNSEKCLHCLRCVSACANQCHGQLEGRHTYDRTRCIACGKCLSPMCGALEIAGKAVSTEEILREVLKDALYYENSGGGLTLSGGEPLTQWEACRELLQKAKGHGIHTCVETCGCVPRKALEQTHSFTDLYLFDWKESNPQKHREYTGIDNQGIRENLQFLDSMQKKIVLRCPIIPSFNDRKDHLFGIAELVNTTRNITQIVIEPYHTLGVEKYRRLGRNYMLPSTPALDGEAAEQVAKELQAITPIPVEIA